MKKSILLLSLLPSFYQTAFAQVSFRKADSLYNEGLGLEAIDEYKQTYNKDSSDDNNIYNLACAYAQIRVPDSAFKYLIIATQKNTTEYALTDPDLIPLYKEKRWGDFEKKFNRPHAKKIRQPHCGCRLCTETLAHACIRSSPLQRY